MLSVLFFATFQYSFSSCIGLYHENLAYIRVCESGLHAPLGVRQLSPGGATAVILAFLLLLYHYIIFFWANICFVLFVPRWQIVCCTITQLCSIFNSIWMHCLHHAMALNILCCFFLLKVLRIRSAFTWTREGAWPNKLQEYSWHMLMSLLTNGKNL